MRYETGTRISATALKQRLERLEVELNETKKFSQRDIKAFADLILRDLPSLDERFEELWTQMDKYHKNSLPPSEKDVFAFIIPEPDACKSGIKSFGSGDDEKAYCNTGFEKDDCIIISIGSAGQWDFEEQVHAQTKCVVHTFDCTGHWEPPAAISDRVFFHQKCVGLEPDNPDFMTYGEILNSISADYVPRYFKIDVGVVS